MNASNAAVSLACGILVLSIVLALVLIPVLDAELRRATARRAANDNAKAVPPAAERRVG